jgi:hypothetical protein
VGAGEGQGRRAGDALGIERVRAQSADPQWIVDDNDAGRKYLLAQFVLEKTGLARNRAAVDGRRQMSDQKYGNRRSKQDGQAT